MALDFVDDVPTKEMTQKVDYIRGIEVFLNFIPAMSLKSEAV